MKTNRKFARHIFLPFNHEINNQFNDYIVFGTYHSPHRLLAVIFVDNQRQKYIMYNHRL